MEPVGILIVVLLALNLAAIVLTGQFLEREVRRRAVRHDESFSELGRRSLTLHSTANAAQTTAKNLADEYRADRAKDKAAYETFLETLWKRLDGLERGGAERDVEKIEAFQAELWKRLDGLERGGAERDVEKIEAFQAELWKRLDRLEGGAADGTAEFEEGVRNLLAYTAGKVPGVEVHL